MCNDTAALTRIVHLHFLHVLHILLVHNHHWIGLRQHNQRRMVEHSRNNRSAFDQPICISKGTGTIRPSKPTKLPGIETLKVADKGISALMVALSAVCCYPRHHTSP